MKVEVVLSVMALSVLAAACRQSAAAKPAAPPPQVVVVPVLQKDQPIYREWIGTTEGDVNAEIRPKIEGYLLRRNYKEGSFVRQGDLLFEIDPQQFRAQLEQAQANLEQANANVAKTEHDVARYEPLAAQKAMSQQELDNARSAERSARANAGAQQAAVDQARMNSAWSRVTSPISGISGIAQAQVGDLVSPQTVLTTVSKVDPIRVLYQMSEQEYLEFQNDPAMRSAELDLILADGSTFPHQGHLLLSGREVNVKTGTIATIGLFPNPGNVLRPGQYAKVRAATRVKRGALLVPQRAVNEMQGAFQVGVVGPGDKVQIRGVTPGERVGSLWIIDQGLSPGDRVIIEGFSRVKSGMTVAPTQAPAEAVSDVSSGAK